MSSDVAIRCEGLSKRYRIGKQERYKALRDVITDAAAAPFRRFRSAIQNGNGNPQSDHVWALDDVSFEVKQGEVVGINSQIYSRSGGFMGISFSIPIDVALDVQQQLRQYGRVRRGRHAVRGPGNARGTAA